jgi:phospholipid transport system substrate-binding protein
MRSMTRAAYCWLMLAVGIVSVTRPGPLHAMADEAAPTDRQAPDAQPPEESAETGATQTIDALQVVLSRVLKESSTLTFEQRVDSLRAAILETYDMEFMALKVLGPYAKQLSDDERRQWFDAFARFTVANYARRFNHYSGQTFETLRAQPASSDTILVRSRVVRPGNTDVDIDYRLHRDGGKWKIVDVYAQGTISELSIRRAEITSLLDTKKFPEVLEYVNQKAARGEQ